MTITATHDSAVEQDIAAADQQAGTAQATIRFTDGAARTFPVSEEQSVLTAAQAAGYPLVSQCEVGTCSTCVATLLAGDASMPDGRPVSLSQDEIAAGQRLLCQTNICGSAELQVDYPSALLDANPTVAFRGKIASITWVADTVVELTLKLPRNFRFGFTAGQYCRLQVPGTDQWRSYSMATGENEKTKVSFLVRILPQGVMSDYLRERARVGDVLEMEGPKGGFVLTPDFRPHLLLAGGTGLAPMMSMLSRLRYVRPAAPPVKLFFGCTNAEQLFYTEELEDRTSFLPSLEVRALLMDNAGRPDVEQGNPVSAISADDLLPGTVVYMCGPPGMMRAAEEKLLELGIPQEDIRMEQFLDSSN